MQLHPLGLQFNEPIAVLHGGQAGGLDPHLPKLRGRFEKRGDVESLNKPFVV